MTSYPWFSMFSFVSRRPPLLLFVVTMYPPPLSHPCKRCRSGYVQFPKLVTFSLCCRAGDDCLPEDCFRSLVLAALDRETKVGTRRRRRPVALGCLGVRDAAWKDVLEPKALGLVVVVGWFLSSPNPPDQRLELRCFVSVLVL